MSIQPNAGSQGELAGLLAIRGYHRANGQEARDVCLIPSSAHGTNAASAVMAGMKVVVVKAAEDGSIDLDDLRAQCDAHADDLAAIMVTYPSTHGAYEDSITELCEIVHGHGGQVYVDGANLNALLGFAQSGRVRRRRLAPQPAQDVLHPARRRWTGRRPGGGACPPGAVPPLARAAPRGRQARGHRRDQRGAVRLGGHPADLVGLHPADGRSGTHPRDRRRPCCRPTTSPARLGDHFPVLYRGHGGLVAHECILDVRGLTKHTGVSVDDVAKRLVDYGFHAPTMSFPVAGTLMVEPTESEDLGEIDRFCDAMIAIKGEIDRVAAGEWSADDSPLRHAPHTSRALVGDWDRAYSRERRRLPERSRPRQVLAAGGPHRPGVRRPQPGLRLPAAGGVRRVSTARTQVV